MKEQEVIINIISLYSPGKRLDNFLNMLDILLNKEYDVSCILQGYPEDTLRILRKKRLDVITCEPKHPGHAMNEFLKRYYKSEYDYFIMLHDDIQLDAKLFTKEQDTLKYLIENIKKTTKNEVVITLQENSFVYRNIKNPIITETLHFWEPAFIMKNLKKIYDVEVYFDEDIYGVEGTQFACNLLRKELKVLAHYGQATFKQMLDKSTYGDRKTRRVKLIECRKQIYEKNKDIFKLTKNFQLRRIKNGI